MTSELRRETFIARRRQRAGRAGPSAPGCPPREGEERRTRGPPPRLLNPRAAHAPSLSARAPLPARWWSDGGRGPGERRRESPCTGREPPLRLMGSAKPQAAEGAGETRKHIERHTPPLTALRPAVE